MNKHNLPPRQPGFTTLETYDNYHRPLTEEGEQMFLLLKHIVDAGCPGMTPEDADKARGIVGKITPYFKQFYIEAQMEEPH